MIIIRVHDNTNLFINKCLKNNINLYDIKYYDDYIETFIENKELQRIKKLNYYSKIDIIKYTGIKKYTLLIKKYFFDFILLIIFCTLIYLISNIILCVEIKHENKEIKNRVQELLNNYNIKAYTFNKTNLELNEISDEILKNNRDFIDFISITKNGMKYIVNIEERKILEESVSNKKCHIKASKSGIITSITASSGVILTEIGASVKANDILISGELTLNEEIKGNVCASGIVRANTWYKINISYPLNETVKKYTKRKKINVKILNNYLKKRLYDNYDEKILFKAGIIRVVRQDEYYLEDYTLDEETSKNKAIEEAINSLNQRIGEYSIILDKKVLKETVNNSTIELEIFVSVDEEISYTSEYEESDADDTNEGI